MKKMIKRKTVILCMLLLGISVSGCGKTREVDEASSKVIQISVAPEETAGISSAESSDSQSDADSTDNSVDSADNNEQDSSTSDTEE